MVTGREIPDLETVFDRFDLFDLIVAENGALLYWPETKKERVLGEAPRADFVEALRTRGVERISVGKRSSPLGSRIRTLCSRRFASSGWSCRSSFNKGAVMILPASVNKRAD